MIQTETDVVWAPLHSQHAASYISSQLDGYEHSFSGRVPSPTFWQDGSVMLSIEIMM